MMVTINIGRYPGEGYTWERLQCIDPDHIVMTWARQHLCPFWVYTVYPKDQEPTIVIHGNIARGPIPWEQSLYALSRNLWQDCIAVMEGDKGFLIGPYANRWGQFNSSFFIGVDHECIKSVQADTRRFPRFRTSPQADRPSQEAGADRQPPV